MIKRLEATDVAAAIDLSDWSFGEKTYSISAANIRIPYGVSVTRITPSKVRLRFEPTAHKTVPIRPRAIGKSADGHRVSSVSCEPGSVRSKVRKDTLPRSILCRRTVLTSVVGRRVLLKRVNLICRRPFGSTFQYPADECRDKDRPVLA